MSEALHGHRLPEADHDPVVWRYKDGCTVEVHEDGSHTFTPFYDAAPVTDAGLREAIKRARTDGLIELPDDLHHRWCAGSGGDDHVFDVEMWLDDVVAALSRQAETA